MNGAADLYDPETEQDPRLLKAALASLGGAPAMVGGGDLYGPASAASLPATAAPAAVPAAPAPSLSPGPGGDLYGAPTGEPQGPTKPAAAEDLYAPPHHLEDYAREHPQPGLNGTYYRNREEMRRWQQGRDVAAKLDQEEEQHRINVAREQEAGRIRSDADLYATMGPDALPYIAARHPGATKPILAGYTREGKAIIVRRDPATGELVREVVEEGGGANPDVIARGNASRDVARINVGGGIQRAQIGAGASNYRADRAAESGEYRADVGAGAHEYGSEVGAISRMADTETTADQRDRAAGETPPVRAPRSLPPRPERPPRPSASAKEVTATNPKTGEKIRWNAQTRSWEPVEAARK